MVLALDCDSFVYIYIIPSCAWQWLCGNGSRWRVTPLAKRSTVASQYLASTYLPYRIVEYIRTVQHDTVYYYYYCILVLFTCIC